MFKKKTKGPAYQVLSQVGSVPVTLTSNRVLLCGEPVFATLESNVQPPSSRFVPQLPRETSSGLVSLFTKASRKLNLWIDERLFGYKKMRFAFAIDGYLAWGLRQRRKGVLVLFGGASSGRETNVEILVFFDGRLQAVNERMLPAMTDPAFLDTRDSLIADLRRKYSTARFVQAGPLPSWNLDVIEYVGDAPLRGLSFKPIEKLSKRRSALLVPALIGAAGFVAYVAFLWVGWLMYSSSQDSYRKAISDPAVHEKGGIDTNFLNTMNARRIYMETPRRQGFLVDKAELVMRGIAKVDRVKVLELRLPAPSVNPQASVGVSISTDGDKKAVDAGRAPDVWVSLSVPKAMTPALMQGKEQVLEGIARNTGMTVRIAQQGISEDKDQRIYNIEGFFHD